MNDYSGAIQAYQDRASVVVDISTHGSEEHCTLRITPQAAGNLIDQIHQAITEAENAMPRLV